MQRGRLSTHVKNANSGLKTPEPFVNKGTQVVNGVVDKFYWSILEIDNPSNLSNNTPISSSVNKVVMSTNVFPLVL
jgi:hypothetical protein